MFFLLRHIMRDPRIDQLARLLIGFSTQLKSGETVLIDYEGAESRELALACAEQAIEAGGVPLVEENNGDLTCTLLRRGNEAQVKLLGNIMLERMKRCQAYIGIRGAGNIYELQGAPREALQWYSQHIKVPVHLNQRVKHSKWVVLRYPNPSMAQLAERSTREFADFYFRVCCFDYERMDRAVKPLAELMERTRQVRIVAPGTDLRFSIEGIHAVPCTGKMNIPDGECFTAPVRDSVEGTVRFNCKSTERLRGVAFEQIALRFQKGRVVEATAEDGAKSRVLNEVLDQDEGARYIGEFAIGFHPHIERPMNDILFDEKIRGSFHMALGSCYDEASNGNKSALHWDLVQIQRPEYGGGEIYFDDRLIRKDGHFIPADLHGLNPEVLGA